MTDATREIVLRAPRSKFFLYLRGTDSYRPVSPAGQSKGRSGSSQGYRDCLTVLCPSSCLVGDLRLKSASEGIAVSLPRHVPAALTLGREINADLDWCMLYRLLAALLCLSVSSGAARSSQTMSIKATLREIRGSVWDPQGQYCGGGGRRVAQGVFALQAPVSSTYNI